MSMGSKVLSAGLGEDLSALGRSVQQDFAPVLGNGNDLPPGVSWEDLPELDGVAADWEAIATMTAALSTLYHWLTTDLLEAEGAETGVLGDIPLSQSPPLTASLQPLSKNQAEARTAMDWGHQDDGGASGIASISNRALEDPRLSMAWGDSENNASREVADVQTGRSASITARPSKVNKPLPDGRVITSQIIQRDQPQPSAIAPRSSAAMPPIFGSFADLATRLTDSGGLKGDYQSESKSVKAGDMGAVGSARPRGTEAEWADGAGNRVTVGGAHPTGTAKAAAYRTHNVDVVGNDNSLRASNSASSAGLGRQTRQPVRASDANEVAAAQPAEMIQSSAIAPESMVARWSALDDLSLSREEGKPQIVQPDQSQPSAMASSSPAARAPIVGGFADLATRLIGVEGHQANSFQDDSYPEPMAMARSAGVDEVETLQWGDRKAPAVTGRRPDTGGLANQTTAALEARSRGEPVDWFASSPPDASVAWAEARLPNELDLEDLMTAIAHTITRDYHRFYGP